MPVHHEINFKVNVSYGSSSISDQNSEETKLVMFILWGVILPPIAVAGLVGNILTIIVLWRREMHSTTILYMRGLVITDTGILIGCVLTLSPISCANYLHGDALVYFRDGIYPVIHTPAYYVIMTLQQCNVWITVSVSMERYIAICHPFRASRLISRRKTLIVLFVIVIVSIIYNIPHIFASRASPCSGSHLPPPKVEHNATFVTRQEGIFGRLSSAIPAPPLSASTPAPPVTQSWQCLEVATTEFGNTQFFTVYRTFMYSIIIYIIPFLALLILNSFLIAELMVMQRRRSGTNIHDENEANLSLVLIMIVIVFIFCQTPGLVAQFDIIPVDIFMKYLSFSNLLFALNSAINFLIYTAFGRKFRRVLLRVFRHLFKKNRRLSQSSYRMTQYTDADFETYDQTEANCTMLRGISCYKKEGSSAENTFENLPLNSARDSSSVERNGLARNTQYINGKSCLRPTAPNADCDTEIIRDCEPSVLLQEDPDVQDCGCVDPTIQPATSSDINYCEEDNKTRPKSNTWSEDKSNTDPDTVPESSELIQKCSYTDSQECCNTDSQESYNTNSQECDKNI